MPFQSVDYDGLSDTSMEVPIMLCEDPAFYRSIAHSNPFYDDHHQLWNRSPEMGSDSLPTSSSSSSLPRACLYPSGSDVPFFPIPGSMPHSKSDGHIDSLDKVDQHELHHVRFEDSESIVLYDRNSCPSRGFVSPVRRCACGRPASTTDKVAENEIADILDSPPRRSRSPHKKLFGENGWLGHSPSVKEQSNKKAGLKTLGEKIKHHVGEIAGDVAKASSIHFRQDSAYSKIISKSSLPTSVDPPTQAKIYSEMEVMICVSANKFLVQQYEEGRMSADSINKITNFWMSKNRPQVPEFQFDQSTQRELILQNLRTFQFYGECSTNPVALNSTLYNWKAVAKEMSVRTFCAPDSVIRKHMHDVYKILEMLGAPLVTVLAFQDLQMQTLTLMQEHLKKNPQRNGAGRTTRGCRRT